jgi:copper chaperone CopZ
MYSFPGIKIMHFFPGRVRLKVDKVKNNAAFANKVKTELSNTLCITEVEINTLTGSVLIKYDKCAIKDTKNSDHLLAALKKLFPDLDAEKLRPYLVN